MRPNWWHGWRLPKRGLWRIEMPRLAELVIPPPPLTWKFGAVLGELLWLFVPRRLLWRLFLPIAMHTIPVGPLHGEGLGPGYRGGFQAPAIGAFNVRAGPFGAMADGSSDDTAAIHLARDAAGSAGHLWFPPGIYRTTGLLASIANQLWDLDQGATIQLLNGATTHALRITATGMEVQGGTIDGNKANVSGVSRGISVQPTSVSPPCTIRRVIVQNTFDDGIFFFQADDSRCLDCRVTGCLKYGINVRGSQRVVVDRNYADASLSTIASSGTAIEVQSTQAGTNCSGCRITNNTVIPGPAATGSGFGIECQVTAGDATFEITVANNSVLYMVGCSGGVSLSAIQQSVASGNTIFANGQTSTFGIEVVGDAQCVVANNSLRGGTTGWTNGISLDQSTGSIIIGNEISGGSTAGALAGIFVGSSLANNVRRNQIIGNRILLANAAVTATRGIFVQANNAGADASENLIANNQIECSGDANSRGIVLELDAGTLANTIVTFNVIRNCNEGIRQFGDTNTTIGPNTFVTVTNNYGSTAPGVGGFYVARESLSADRGDASVTLVVDTDAILQLFNTPLTIARTVTLPATRLPNGARFRVVRTAGATGAATLTVQTLLNGNKALAAGQEVEMTWTGTSWIETMGVAML